MRRVFLIFILFTASSTAYSTIYFDFEPDPIPVIEISAVIPGGFSMNDKKTPGALNLLPYFFESGTAKLSRQEFVDAMAEFAASLDFTVGRQYSYVSLSFPYLPKKDYSKLLSLVKQAFEAPRFDQKTLALAKKKFTALLKGSLDSDASMLASTIRRWQHKKTLGGRPVYIEDIPERKIEEIRSAYAALRAAESVWVGALAPEDARPLVEKITRTLFPKQRKIDSQRYLKQLPIEDVKPVSDKTKKQLLVLDKDDQKQIIFSVLALGHKPLEAKKELPFLIGSFSLVENGFGAVFQDVIRREHGLAYYVSSMGTQYLGLPSIGFLTNPQADKSLEAIGVISKLIEGAYSKDTIFKQYPKKTWADVIRSFRYGKILSTNTSEKRLAERMAVVTGEMSPEFYKSNPSGWNKSPKDVAKVYNQVWSESSKVIGVVGKASDLVPMLRLHFPKYEIKVIPYKQSISQKAYN